MTNSDPKECVSRKVFLKLKVNWNAIFVAIQELPRCNIWSPDNPGEVLISPFWLDVKY